MSRIDYPATVDRWYLSTRPDWRTRRPDGTGYAPAGYDDPIELRDGRIVDHDDPHRTFPDGSAVTLPDGSVVITEGSDCLCGMADWEAPDEPTVGGDCRSIGCNPDCPECGGDD